MQKETDIHVKCQQFSSPYSVDKALQRSKNNNNSKLIKTLSPICSITHRYNISKTYLISNVTVTNKGV